MFLCTDCAKSLTKEISCISQDRDDRNPCWRSYKVFELSGCFIRLLAIVCSQSLEQMQVKEMGLYLLESCLSPFLNTGHTLTCFQSDGIVPESKDF